MNDFITRFVLLAALFTVFGYMSLCAQSFEHDGLTYNVTGGNEVEVTGYTVEPVNLVIPATVSYEGTDYEVTGIGMNAFKYCTDMVSVDFPENLTYIGEYAFMFCEALASIDFPESLTSIGGYAFDGAFYDNPVTIDLPENLTDIGEWAFAHCTNLFSVDFSESLTSIGNHAFFACSSLTSVELSKNLVVIDSMAFSACRSLEYISVDAGNANYCSQDGVLFTKDMTELICCPGGRGGYYAVPSGVASICDYAFNGCSNLISIDIPASVMDIGMGAFASCSSVEALNVDAGNSNYCSRDGVLFTGDMAGLIRYPAGKKEAYYAVPSGVVTISDNAFDSSYNLISVDLPDGLTDIGSGAFYSCMGLADIDFPESLKKIGSSAFNYCSSLTSVDLPDGLTSIESWTFAACSNLASVDFPDNLKSIGSSAFNSCSSLTSVCLPESLANLESQVFFGSSLASVVILSDALEADGDAFIMCDSLKEVLVFGETYPTAVDNGLGFSLFDDSNYTLYSFSDETLPEFWSAPAATVKLSLGGLSDKMPYTGKFPDLYIDGNASSYEMTVDESSMTFDTAPGTHTLDSFGFWLYKDGYEADKTLVTINQPVTYTIEGAGIDDAAASGIGCYPGVADDMLTVSGTVAGASLRVIDLSGAQRMSVACTDGETAVDVSSLAQGMYFVLVEDGGDVAARLRFVKK